MNKVRKPTHIICLAIMNEVRRSTFLTACLTVLSASVLAAPTMPLQQMSAQANCAAVPMDAPRGPGSQWAHVSNVLHGSDDADLVGLNGPCRLVDMPGERHVGLNDGIDIESLKQINAWLEAISKDENDDGEQLRDTDAGLVTVAIDNSDKQLHVYLGLGVDKANLGPLGSQDAWPDSDYNHSPGSRIDIALGDTNQQYHADTRTNARRQGMEAMSGHSAPPPLPAIPEPATYATMLAGLACLCVVLRRKRS